MSFHLFIYQEIFMARTSPTTQLEKIRAARIKLEKEEQRLMLRGHDKALAQIVQIAHTAGLTAAQIAQAMGVKGKVKTAAKTSAAKTSKAKRSTAGKKVAPKYRDPAHPDNSWTGRGRMPQWVQALHAAGTLASAEIKTAE
jgi:DNA-binding protein H-NS